MDLQKKNEEQNLRTLLTYEKEQFYKAELGSVSREK